MTHPAEHLALAPPDRATTVEWHVAVGSNLHVADDQLVVSCLEVLREASRSPQRSTVEDIRASLKRVDLAAYAYVAGQMIGFAHFRVIDVPGDGAGRAMLWEESLWFRPAFESEQLTKAALSCAWQGACPTKSIGWVGGCSRDPDSWRYRKFVGAGALMQFDPAGGDGIGRLRVLASEKGNLPARIHVGMTDRSAPGPEGLGPQITEAIASFGLDVDRGDAVVLIGELDGARRRQPTAPSGFEVVERKGPSGFDEALARLYTEIFAEWPYCEQWSTEAAFASIGAEPTFVVVLRDGDPVAFSAMRPLVGVFAQEAYAKLESRERRARAWDDARYISEVAVHREYRRDGLGSFLVRRLVSQAPADAPLVLRTHAANGPAVELYRRHGFRLADIEPQQLGVSRTAGALQFDARLVMVK